MSEKEQNVNFIDEELKNIESSELTLDGESRKIDLSFMEPELKNVKMKVVDNSSQIAAGSVDESMLSESEKKQVEEFVKKVDITDVKLVNSYGSGAQRGISTFSSSITGTVKTKDFNEVGDSLRELKVAINSSITQPKKGLFGLFQKEKQKINYVIANYENAETSIKSIEKDLKKHQQQLMKDVFIYDQMYTMNLEFYKELTMYIIAGKKALELAKGDKLDELREKADTTQDQLDVQAYNDYLSSCKRFEKRVYDLETTRLVSIQMAPQIRLLQNANQDVVDKLHSDVINTIPLWRNQMVLTLGIEHTTRALNAQSAIDEMTNEMFRRNAETLKQGAIDAARASESSIIDIETLQKVNDDIITSINEVVKIHEEGTKRRSEAQVELAQIEDKLKHALLEAGSR